jgi:hypothetical protein
MILNMYDIILYVVLCRSQKQISQTTQYLQSWVLLAVIKDSYNIPNR